ncbi:MAG: hypothetical protein ACQESR_02755 [Planctomycetota bacterium]
MTDDVNVEPTKRLNGFEKYLTVWVPSLVGSAGPFLAPFFLSYGLVRGASIGTEALSTAIMHITKMATYGSSGAFAQEAVVAGILLAPVMIAGSYLGKLLVDRIPERVLVGNPGWVERVATGVHQPHVLRPPGQQDVPPARPKSFGDRSRCYGENRRRLVGRVSRPVRSVFCYHGWCFDGPGDPSYTPLVQPVG